MYLSCPAATSFLVICGANCPTFCIFVQRIIKVVVVWEATSIFQKKLFPKGEDKVGLLPAEASLHREVNVKTTTGNATARTK